MRIARRDMATGVWLGVAFTAGSCRDPQPERRVEQFYPNGQLQVVATLRGNYLHGRTVWYLPTGGLESTSHWREGQRTGVTCVYYSGGALHDSLGFWNDTLHGPSLRYYRNGALQRVERYTHGVQTGTAVAFDSLGRRTQQTTYDRNGNQIFYLFYDAHGAPSSGTPAPITDAPDTVRWGEPYTGSIRFGYPLKGQVTMIVGVLGKDMNALDRWPIVDTFQVVPQSKDGRFYFSYYPKRPGKNSFQYKFIQPESPVMAAFEDSLRVDLKSVTHPFFVKKPRR